MRPSRNSKTRFVQEHKAQINAVSLIDIRRRDPLGEEHAADHQGAEDDFGGQAAPCAGSRHRGASVRQHVAADAGERRRGGQPERRRADDNTLLAVRPEKRILMIVVTADMGKAGGFNANLIQAGAAFRRRTSLE